MDVIKRARSRFTKSEWWTIRTKKQKRILHGTILGFIALGAIILSITIAYDHERPSTINAFDPDYMLGKDGMMIDNHYNKRWRPNLFTESPKRPTSVPLSWEEIDSQWFDQKQKLKTISRMTTTTTTTTTTQAPIITTQTVTTTTTQVPTTKSERSTTTITRVPTTKAETSTATNTPAPTTTKEIPTITITTHALTTIQRQTPITTSTTPLPRTSRTSTMPTTTTAVINEQTINHKSINFNPNSTSRIRSESGSLLPSNVISPTTSSTESYDNKTIASNDSVQLRFNETNESLLVTPKPTNPTARNNMQQNSTVLIFERSTATSQSVEEQHSEERNKNQKINKTNLARNQTRIAWTEDEGKFLNLSVSSKENENLTGSTNLDVTTMPFNASDVPKVFHLNASMQIESSINSETIGSASRHHHSKKPSIPKTTSQTSTITEPSEIIDFSYPQSNFCLEDECFIVAHKLNESIDQNIEPCENFYQHVCGNWDQLHPTTTGLRGTVLNSDIKEDIKDLLTQPPLQYDSKAVKNVKTLYRACVKRVTEDRVSLIFLQKAMSKLTSFVRKSKSPVEGPDLGKLAIHLITLHSNYLFPIGVVKDSMNVSRNVLHIGINKLLLLKKKNYESRLPYFNALRDLITEIANIMGVKTIVHKVLGFELLLSQITPEYTGNFQNEYNPTTIGELESTTNVPWRQIFQSALDLTGENITIGLNESVIVQSKEYLKKLLELLRDSDESDLIDYTVIRFVLPKLDAMPDQFYELYQRYEKVISGIEGENRQLSCVLFAGNMMPGVVGKIYSDRYFSEAVKYRNIHVPKMIHSTALDMVRKLTWMDRSTKLEGLKKLYSMLQMIGNDETLSGDPFINQFQFMDDHMKNLFILDKYRTLRTFSLLRTTNSRGKWAINSHPFEMKSFYAPVQNAIYIPAAMFQQPLFHDDLPLTMQFGALGSTVGHAYIHALDIIGSKFNDNGNMRNWWTNKTRKNFQSRIAALNDYTLQDFGDKGIIESSADIGGVKISWRALKKMQKEFNLIPMVLPGLNYTSDQLFFINYARAWCDEEMMHHAMDSAGISTKLPAKNRVIITLQNLPSFSEAFHCKVGDYMNPKDKTHIW